MYVRGEMEGTLTEVHVIMTTPAPILYLLRTAYSTILVNFFTYNKAFSIYPRQTFLRHHAFHLQRDGSSYSSFVDQHQQRGWEFPIIESSPLHNQGYPIQEVRRIGDTDTWSIPLEADNMLGSPPHYALEYCQFSCKIAFDYGIPSSLVDPEGFPFDIANYRMVTTSFTAGCLRYQYAVSPRCSWKKIFSHELVRHTKGRTSKAIPSNKSTDVGGSAFIVHSDATRQNSSQNDLTRTFIDNEIPQIYNK